MIGGWGMPEHGGRLWKPALCLVDDSYTQTIDATSQGN